MGFSSVPGDVTVRFAWPKGFVETEGAVISDTKVSFLTPNLEKYGPLQVRTSTVILIESMAVKSAHGNIEAGTAI